MPRWLKMLWFFPSACFAVWFFALSWSHPTLTDMQLWQMVIGQYWKFLTGMIVLQVAAIVIVRGDKRA